MVEVMNIALLLPSHFFLTRTCGRTLPILGGLMQWMFQFHRMVVFFRRLNVVSTKAKVQRIIQPPSLGGLE